MKYIIALIAILLIFYLHGRMAYESLDTSFGSSGKRVVEEGMNVRVKVGPEIVTVEGFKGKGVAAAAGTSGDPQRCQNWRQLRFDVPPLVPGVNVNVAETEAEIGEWGGEEVEEGFVGNFFSEKMEKFKGLFSGSGKGRGSFDVAKKEDKSAVETLKEEMDTALKGEPTKSVQETFGKVVPAINPTPQPIPENKVLVAAAKNNSFKMGLVKPEGKMGFYEECPTGWYDSGAHFSITGGNVELKCNKRKGSKADAFVTLKSGKVNAVHIRNGGKYNGTNKDNKVTVEFRSKNNDKGKGATGIVHHNKDGSIKRVEITNKGDGYESPPDVVFTESKKKKCKLCVKPKVILK